MTTIEASAHREMPVPAPVAYDILSDYWGHHPHILPKPTFETLRVLAGGRGAGTTIEVVMRVMGTRSTLTMDVREPEPGRVLEEVDRATGAVTRFTVEPTGTGSRVTISTTWPRRPGLRGWLDAKMLPGFATKLYAKELDNMETYATRLVVKPAAP